MVRHATFLWTLGSLAAVLMGTSSCLFAAESGRYHCDGQEPDCPSGMTCLGGRCVDTCVEGQACQTGLPGACSVGGLRCEGAAPTCVPPLPSVETCNGLDDDCNGVTDDGLTPPPGACLSAGVCSATEATCAGELGWICRYPATYTADEDGSDCDQKDNDCDGRTDENGDCVCYPPATQPCGTDEGECRQGQQSCVGSDWGPCLDEGPPVPEECDGLDNDCDGDTDEGNPGAGEACTNTAAVGGCRRGTTDCQSGAPACVPGSPQTEVCNAVDDDCDGSLNETFPEEGDPCTLTAPVYGACTAGITICAGDVLGCTQVVQPVAEICNGVDDDCDDSVDEGNPGGGAACTAAGELGRCQQGTERCVGGSVSCVPNFVPDQLPEECNGLDDDCDGAIDEDLGAACTCDLGPPAETQPCYTGDPATRGQGQCSDGEQTCEAGPAWGQCLLQTLPSTEVCNGLDDDCDGTTDNDPSDAGAPCDTGLPGECRNGVEVCSAGSVSCVPNRQPATVEEICNNLDDDCDGSTDESDPELGQPCTVPGALGECALGERACSTGGLYCMQTVESANELCNSKDDDCDGSTDEGILPINRENCPMQLGVCAGSKKICDAGSWLDCGVPEYTAHAAATGKTYEATETLCDAFDNDCDGTVNGTAAVDQSCSDADGLFCNGAETCQSGACGAGTPPDCRGPGGCTLPVCNETLDVCENPPHDPACDDGNVCTVGTCEATGACTQANLTDGTACSIGPCSSQCRDGLCEGCECNNDTDCPPDGIACTVTRCVSGDCQHLPDDGFCDDGSECTGTEACLPGNPAADGNGCVAGVPLDCDDNNACTADTCVAGSGCRSDPLNSVGCGDGCWCENGTAVETRCNDESDNDKDSLTDCADPDCDAEECVAGGSNPGCCRSFACDTNDGGYECTCVATEQPSELSCGDGADNDCDGLADCADPDCVGRTCVSGCCLANGSCSITPCSGSDGGVTTDGGSPTCGPGCDTSDPWQCIWCSGTLGTACQGLAGCRRCTDGYCNAAVGECGECSVGICLTANICLVPVTPDTEVEVGFGCENNTDDDNDGLTDCSDPDCYLSTCGSGSGADCHCLPDMCADKSSGVLCPD